MASTTLRAATRRPTQTPAVHSDTIAGLGPWVAAAVAFVVTLTQLTRSSITLVETATVLAATRPLAKLPALLGHTDAVLGPFYVFMHAWLKVSHSLWWIRLPGVIASAATAALVVVIGRRRSARVGLVAGLVFAIAPMTSRYAEDARPYSFAILAATLATWRLLVAVEYPTRRRWAWYAVCIALVGLVHLFALLLIPAHAWYARRHLRAWALSAGPILLVLSPLLFYGATEVNSELTWARRPGLHAVRAFVGELSGNAALTIVLGVLVVAGAALAWRSDRDLAASFALWLALPSAVLFAVSQPHPVFANRYLAFTLPALCMLVAVAVAELRAPIAVTVIALIAVLAVPSQVALRRPTPRDGVNVALIASEVRKLVAPGDGLIYEPTVVRRIFYAYATAPPGQDVLLKSSPYASNTLNGRDVSPATLAQRISVLHRIWVVQLIDQLSQAPIYRDATADLQRFHEVDKIAIPGGAIALWVAP